MILSEGMLYDGQIVKCEGLLFMGDLHLTSQRPGRRIEENWPEPILRKLRFCADLCRERNLYPVAVGDKFDRPVERREKVKIDAVRVLKTFPYLTIWNVGNHDTANVVLGDDDSLTLLAECDALDVCVKNGAVAKFAIGDKIVGLGMTPYGMPIPDRAPEDLSDCDKVVWVTHADLAFEGAYPGALELFPIAGCDLVINGHMHLTKDPIRCGSTLWANIGSLVRESVDLMDHVPTVWIYDGRRLEPIEVPHEQHVFNLTGRLIAPTSRRDALAQAEADEFQRRESAFVSVLKETDSLDMAKTDDGTVVLEEMNRVCAEVKPSPLARTLLKTLHSKAVEKREGKS